MSPTTLRRIATAWLALAILAAFFAGAVAMVAPDPLFRGISVFIYTLAATGAGVNACRAVLEVQS